MRPAETIPGMGEGDKGEWRGEFSNDTLVILVNVIMYHQYNSNKNNGNNK
jgi:hypothetical protein